MEKNEYTNENENMTIIFYPNDATKKSWEVMVIGSLGLLRCKLLPL